MPSAAGVRRRLQSLVGGQEHPPLHRTKTRAIDFAFEDLGVRSLADLGGVWAVLGGYTFHALENHDPERAVLVDEDRPPELVERARKFPALELMQANFGDPAVPARIGKIDAVLLFDVLLHQVDPDWDDILAMYAEAAWCMVIVQPQYVAAEKTARLFDLGKEGYEQAVPPGSFPLDLFDHLDEPHPRRDRPWRDVHEVWQWGMTDSDLRARMEELGYSLVYWANGGAWRRSPAFEDHAFVFARTDRARDALVARGPVSGEAYGG